MLNNVRYYLGFDFGASSGRAILGMLGTDPADTRYYSQVQRRLTLLDIASTATEPRYEPLSTCTPDDF